MKSNFTLPALCILTLSILFFACETPPPAEDTSAKEEWQSLFNHVNLDGWAPKIRGYALNDNFANTFIVEDSMMKVRYDSSTYGPYNDRFGHIFYKEPFSFYRLKIDYRFVGNQVLGGPEWAIRNSGLMYHCQSPESMGKDQDFPVSLEGQFLGGDGQAERSTMNLCTPGTNVVRNDTFTTDHCMVSSSKTFHGDQWVSAEFLVLGDSLIQHFVNGEKVFEFTKPTYGGGATSNFDTTLYKEGQPITGGYLSLQSESHPIDFRKVEILNLEGCMDKKAKNYKAYYVKSKESACIYE